MKTNPTAGSVPSQLHHLFPLAAQALEERPHVEAVLQRITERRALGFDSGLHYLLAVTAPTALPRLVRGEVGPSPDFPDRLDRMDGSLVRFIERLDAVSRGSVPLEGLLVSLIEQAGVDPFPQAQRPAPLETDQQR